jgi:hypothetical protein
LGLFLFQFNHQYRYQRLNQGSPQQLDQHRAIGVTTVSNPERARLIFGAVPDER